MKWTKENIISFINENTNYKFIDFVINNGIYSEVIIKCDKHGEFKSKFTNLKNSVTRNNILCDKCSKEKRSEKNRLPIEKVRSIIEDRGYILLSKEYINSSVDLYLQCKKCNHKFYMTFGNFNYNNQGCPKCAQIKRIEKTKHSYDYIKNIIEEDMNYVLLSNEYINAHEKLSIYCIKHNNIFLLSFHGFQQGNRCPICSNESRAAKLKHSYDYVKNYIQNEGDELLSNEYTNNLELLDIRCGKNSHEYKMSFGNYISGHRCPYCNDSSGENEISKILDTFNIKYICQYSFNDCVYKSKLRFDFYLPEYNTCIEFDGQQHFEAIDYFGGQESFELGQIRDNIKNNYCVENNIKLIRIPYWDFDNIENILCNELILNNNE